MNRTMVAICFGALLLSARASAQTKPQFIPNSLKYRNAGLQPATGRSGSASLTARALLGNDRQTDLEMTTGVLDSPATAVGNISKVQVKLIKQNGVVAYSRYNNLEVGGYYKLTFNEFLRGQRLQVQANISGIDPSRTDVVTVQETVKLRPDLRASDLSLPSSALVNTPVNIAATVQERNFDVGAQADCVLYVDSSAVDRANGIWVDAGGTVSCAFTYTFTSPGSKAIAVKVENVVPGGYDPSNNAVSGSLAVQSGSAFYYWAQSYDYDFHNYYKAQGSYRYSDGTYDSNYDWARDYDSRGWQQGVYFSGWTPNYVSFPLNISKSETNDGSTVFSASFTSVPADWTSSWSDGTTNYTYSCVSRWDSASNNWLQLCTYLVREISSGNTRGETGFYFNRYAGDVTYHSAGYSHWWSQYQGYDYYYSWNYDGQATYGLTRVALGNQYGINISIADASRTYASSAIITLQPLNAVAQQPWTCYEYTGRSYTQRVCQEYDYSYIGKSGYTYGSP